MVIYVASSFQTTDRFGVSFNTSTGALNNAGGITGTALLYNSSAEYYGDGWWRISVSGTTGVAGTTNQILFIVVDNSAYSSTIGAVRAGDGSTGFYVWGAQLEQSKQQTSFIPSTETFTSRASTAT
jgi:pyruvate/2-oxoacid:ferredoxin oxidoreductase beta subunit